jgi:hypothetical protein
MTNFNSLPIELVIEIVKTSLAFVHDTKHLPTIGLDASYFVPHDTDIDFKESGKSRAESMDSTRAVVSLSLASKPDGPHRTSSQPPFGLCTMTKSLRL